MPSARSATSSSASSRTSAAEVGAVSRRRPGDRPVHLQRHVLPALPGRLDHHCVRGGIFGNGVVDGGQGEAVRVPLAGSTLVAVPGSRPSDETLRSLLALSDVMSTGHHAAVSAGVKPGDTVAVVGDGAVGLSAVLASKRLGAERIIALSRNPTASKLARSSAPPTSSRNAAMAPTRR